MLVLEREYGETVYLDLPDGSEIRVMVVGIKNGKVRLGFEAKPEVRIMRAELVEGRSK